VITIIGASVNLCSSEDLTSQGIIWCTVLKFYLAPDGPNNFFAGKAAKNG